MDRPESPGAGATSATDGGSEADTDETGGAVVEQISADAAFELLGNETRLDILRALFDADGPLSFSALNDEVGMRDSGRFNYHLDKLQQVFVRKTDAGYELTAEGTDAVGSVLAGPYTKTVDADPVRVDAACTSCGGPLAGVFGEDSVSVTCEDCGRNVIRLPVPPGAFEEYPREEWPLVAEQWTRRRFETMQRGFCSACHGPTTAEVVTDPDRLHDVFDVGVRYACERCGEDLFANAEASVLSRPPVVAFLHERGVDATTTPVWELDWAVRPGADVVATDPLRVTVPVECDGDRLVLTLDEAAAVVDERVE